MPTPYNAPLHTHKKLITVPCAEHAKRPVESVAVDLLDGHFERRWWDRLDEGYRTRWVAPRERDVATAMFTLIVIDREQPDRHDIAEKAGCSLATVSRGIESLRQIGLLRWNLSFEIEVLRRSPDVTEKVVRQKPHAYSFSLPAGNQPLMPKLRLNASADALARYEHSVDRDPVQKAKRDEARAAAATLAAALAAVPVAAAPEAAGAAQQTLDLSDETQKVPVKSPLQGVLEKPLAGSGCRAATSSVDVPASGGEVPVPNETASQRHLKKIANNRELRVAEHLRAQPRKVWKTERTFRR